MSEKEVLFLNPKIFNVQRYSIHDGEGIRTTIFFKGCPLRCPWCHNPESQRFIEELLYSKERCSGCLSCIKICPEGAIFMDNNEIKIHKALCKLCGKCTEFCVNNAREIIGKEYAIEEIEKLIERDFMFYEESNGGVTLSGGEVMAQDISYIETLVKRLKKKGYNIAIDTCGYAPYENYLRILPYVDVFLYDIKIINKDKHLNIIGKDNDLILSNLKKLSIQGANINIRIPVIGGINDDEKSINDIVNFLKDNVVVKQVNLLPYHNTGSGKYEKVGEKYLGDNFYTPDEDRLNDIKRIFQDAGFSNVKIGG